ncbi:MAG: NAD-specific glutamate dehydrogenase [Legionellaceae bacterium]
MTSQAQEKRDTILAKIAELVNAKLSAKQAKLLNTFIPQYFAFTATEDLASRDIVDLYGAILSHWNLISQRKPGETHLAIYNPYYGEHGWQSTHTIIEVSMEDMPFIVDSLKMEINRRGFNIHLMIHLGGLKIKRDEAGNVTQIFPYNDPTAKIPAEAAAYIEIDRQTDPTVLKELKFSLEKILLDVRHAVTDWQPMLTKMQESIAELEKCPPKKIDLEELAESKAFLHWLIGNHFTFLGCRDYELSGEGDELALKEVENSGLGILSDEGHGKTLKPLSQLPPEARRQALSPQILIITETNFKSSIHRPAYIKYIGVKRFDNEGKLIGERRFIGLYTSTAYSSNPAEIPFLRHKVATIMQHSNLPRNSHAGKALINILESLPRDDLFEGTTDELFDIVMGILFMHERPMIRLFVRKDIYHRFFSCLVYLPRELVNTDLRQKMQEILMHEFQGSESSFDTRFSESVLANIHFVIRVNSHQELEYDIKHIEQMLIDGARSWDDELKERLVETFGEENGNILAQKYRYAFPPGYKADFESRVAVHDIHYLEKLKQDNQLEMNFYRPLDEGLSILRFKLFQQEYSIPLTDVLPMLENMGLRVLGERPHEVILKNGNDFWINDFGMEYISDATIDISPVRENFQQAFQAIWKGQAENDGFNRLILGAQLSWCETAILRAYSKYLRQTGFTFSQQYIEETLAKHPTIVRYLIDIFNLRFDPNIALENNKQEKISSIENTLYIALNAVANLDEDRILRRFHILIMATLRTNYFQTKDNAPKDYISFKLDPSAIPDLPLPRPMFEIFVYSPRFEGVHLRGGNVARGGLRWSDRREDFRTEILGLMKAQQVKNAVIVPSGAKGGFVPKQLPTDGNRDTLMAEVVTCYQNFIRGLLDITDNIGTLGEIIPPIDTVRYDNDDPYLVVAADKGTAAFSDYANAISKEYNFWLGDAFASGGSVGYDHKKIAITARGAWESVKRHFREIAINPQEKDFTVVGIGDMSGDVFGNGLLLSRHIKLVGAFNHMHIFLDPNPEPEASFKERERLFNLPRSTWEDYNSEIISQGGGVYKRTAKSIPLTPEVNALLGLEGDSIVPNDLIRALLKAPVDLLWNGGIGTYVKAIEERDTEVGDRANDAIRINGSELQCKVVGEGGNLGFTQLGRIEYALNGGRINTDFIDNSAGVDCSDHEVNIKILLNGIVTNGDMTVKQRNQLLAEMTDEVVSLVLRDNYDQTQALSLATAQVTENLDLYSRYLDEQERLGLLPRALEFLPDVKTITERKRLSKSLTRPELAVLLAYCKMNVKQEILRSDLPEDPFLSHAVENEFPQILSRKYRAQMENHSLRREIIATQLSSAMVNNMGITFVHRLHDETGATVSSIVRAYTVAQHVFGMRELLSLIESLDYKIGAELQMWMMTRVIRLVRRATRWFLRNRRSNLDIEATIKHFGAGVTQLYNHLPKLLTGKAKEKFTSLETHLLDNGVPQKIASRIALSSSMFTTLDIIETATAQDLSLDEVATVYAMLDERLELAWFREQISAHPIGNHWDALARAGLHDDVDLQQRSLTMSVLLVQTKSKSLSEKLNVWLNLHESLVARWHYMLDKLRNTDHVEFLMFTVAVRELLDLTQASIQKAKPSNLLM